MLEISLPIVHNLSVPSLKLYALFAQLILTSALLWTKYACISVTLGPNYSNEDFDSAQNSYQPLILVGIFLICLQLFMMTYNLLEITFRRVISLALDAGAIFFLLWTILDAWSWRTYIYIFVFCQ